MDNKSKCQLNIPSDVDRLCACSNIKKSKWQDNLPSDVYNRLCSCSNTKEDLPILVNARWKYMKESGKDSMGFTREDALVFILDWLDSNNQWSLCELTREEYDELKEDRL